MSKQIPKAKLDAAIEQARNYYKDYDVDVLADMMEACREADKAAELILHTIVELLTSILRPYSLKENATNEDIYKVLEVLGWQVSDDDKVDN